MPLNFGKWENGENPKPGIPKKGEGEGHLTPAPIEEAFRSDLPAEPITRKLIEGQESYSSAISIRWSHRCSTRSKCRAGGTCVQLNVADGGAPKKVATQAI